MDEIELRIKRIYDYRWNNSSVSERISKLKEEVEELEEAIYEKSPLKIAKEIADCVFVLATIAYKYTGYSLKECLLLKLPILEQRMENVKAGRPEKEGE